MQGARRLPLVKKPTQGAISLQAMGIRNRAASLSLPVLKQRKPLRRAR